jgi:hypothetical protein
MNIRSFSPVSVESISLLDKRSGKKEIIVPTRDFKTYSIFMVSNKIGSVNRLIFNKNQN